MPNFTSQVFDPTRFNPAPTTISLSANSVHLVSTGTVSGVQVQGVVFNPVTPLTGIFRTLSAFSGTQLNVDQAYSGSQMAFIFANGTSSLFTVLTAATTTVQTLTAPIAGDANYPELRRKRLLEF
jgi:hypothetical protein